MKKLLPCFLALFLALSLVGCSPADDGGGGNTTTPPASETPASDTPENTDTPASDTPENTDAPAPETNNNERISMMTQEYDEQNIVEIPYIEFEGENADLETINRILSQGHQMRYEEFLDSKLEGEWIEIKTYPFTTDQYLQIVITKVIYPNYGTEGEIESINYDRVAKKTLSVQDALDMLDMSEDDVKADFQKAMVPASEYETFSDAAICGFLIGTGGNVSLLLNVTLENGDGDRREQFYQYAPSKTQDIADVTELSNYCLFDPYDMDEMDPPLWYQKNA